MGEITGVKRNLFRKVFEFIFKRGEGMGRKQLVRETKAAALARMEDAARTEDDFNAVMAQWNHLDENRERKERYHEM